MLKTSDEKTSPNVVETSLKLKDLSISFPSFKIKKFSKRKNKLRTINLQKFICAFQPKEVKERLNKLNSIETEETNESSESVNFSEKSLENLHKGLKKHVFKGEFDLTNREYQKILIIVFFQVIY